MFRGQFSDRVDELYFSVHGVIKTRSSGSSRRGNARPPGDHGVGGGCHHGCHAVIETLDGSAAVIGALERAPPSSCRWCASAGGRAQHRPVPRRWSAHEQAMTWRTCTVVLQPSRSDAAQADHAMRPGPGQPADLLLNMDLDDALQAFVRSPGWWRASVN